MTQEDKELLLKDLSARAQYRPNILVSKGVRIHVNGKIKESDLIDVVYGVIFYNNEPKIVTSQNFSYLDRNGIYHSGGWTADEVKPYLRPMSSMTEEEVFEYLSACDKDYKDSLTTPRHSGVDWLISHHFDYRGLIEKGLALEAPEGIYE